MLSFDIPFHCTAKEVGTKDAFLSLNNTPYQKKLKCWRNDLKMNRSVGFQHVGLTKEFIVELNW